jgi:hypothetical protein
MSRIKERMRQADALKLVREALNLPPDTLIVKNDSTYYYYVTEDTVTEVDLLKVWAYLSDNMRYEPRPYPSQLEMSFSNSEELSSGVTSQTVTAEHAAPPKRAEQLLLLVLNKQEREYLVGDLEEEFKQIAAKHGARYAKLWYYKQVAASAWPMMRKAAGWGLLASVGAWIRKFI